MAKNGIGAMLAKAAPPPDKLGKGDAYEPDGDEPAEDEDEDKAAAVGIMEEFLGAIGVKADAAAAQEACDALERYLDARGYTRR